VKQVSRSTCCFIVLLCTCRFVACACEAAPADGQHLAPVPPVGVGAAAAPGMPPPPPVHHGGGKGGGKAANRHWASVEICDNAGTIIGCLKYGEAQCVLSAHCWVDGCAHGLCRMDRTAKGSTSRAYAARGRPIGLLIAWLRRGIMYGSREDHFASRHGISFQERSEAREWAMAQPELAAMLAKERAPRPGEGDEPDECP
jgi:hypothetical protein